MMKGTRRMLLCCLLMLCCAACGAAAKQTDAAVRVGDVVYALQPVQSALTSSRLLYETAGVSLNDEQKQQLVNSVLEHFIGLGVLVKPAARGGARRSMTIRRSACWMSRPGRPTRRHGSR